MVKSSVPFLLLSRWFYLSPTSWGMSSWNLFNFRPGYILGFTTASQTTRLGKGSCHDLAKRTSYFFSFSIFIFIFIYLVESLLWRWSMGKESRHCHKRCDKCHSHSHNTWQGSYMMGNMRIMGSEVHSYNSSYIYSVENQMGTLLSFPCQLKLGVDLSCLG